MKINNYAILFMSGGGNLCIGRSEVHAKNNDTIRPETY
jgi:hypothetical protein